LAEQEHCLLLLQALVLELLVLLRGVQVMVQQRLCLQLLQLSGPSASGVADQCH
jgi:hypothetical protein